MDNLINFMDLSRQYNKYKKEFLGAIEQVCEETAFSGGKYVEKFEREFANYIGTKYCSCVNSGTTAIFFAMKVLGIGEGDEVIIPSNTFIGSAWGVVYTRAVPVFVDCTSDTWEIDASKIEECITEKTKAIIGVHLYGQPFDFDAVKEVAQKHNLLIVEDCAQAHGALYKNKKVGQLGDIACFSFYPGKNLGGYGEGGAITTNSFEHYEKINMLKDHGSMQKYHHDIVGYNARMDGIQGAVLSCKLKYLDEWNSKRKAIAKRYLDEICNDKITFQHVPKSVVPIYHIFEAMVDDSSKFIKYMEDNGIICGRHYPIPCHLQDVFKSLVYKCGDNYNSEELAKRCVSLPMFPELMDEEVNKVISVCNAY